MTRLFKDGATYTYNAGIAKYITNEFGYTDSVAGTKNTNGAFEMFNFNSAATFAQKSDNSVAGEMRDCGECHVGGGMMEYVNNTIPAASVTGPVSYDPANRTPLRDYAFGAAVTAFNYFIDIFNPNPAIKGQAVQNNYATTGVLEMDCLMCHLQGYSWEARRDAVRQGNFDASRAAGAGIIKQIINGKQVFYNATSVVFNNSTSATNRYLKLAPSFASRLNPMPDSTNCASCHMNQYQVDWKKRGEQWLPGKDAHYYIGCMGCHERTGTYPDPVGTAGKSGLTSDTKLGLCDPAKGSKSPYDALWNALDGQEFRECTECHTNTASASFGKFGAPTANAIHAAFGLASSASGGKIAYTKTGARASHLDIIDCTACHIRKSGFDGGALVDGTGADAQGRVALHDEPQVSRSMDNGTALHWLGGKLYATNLLTSFFWRDMNDVNYDANNDGRAGGMDALLQTHVNNINIANGKMALTKGDAALTVPLGTVNSASIAARQALLLAGIEAQNGLTIPLKTDLVTKNFAPRLSFLVVPFKASHNVAPATSAWGAKGCKECHALNDGTVKLSDGTTNAGGFYNGTYNIKGNMTEFSYGANQVATFTKNNGKVDPSDGHPGIKNKVGDRSIAFKVVNPAGGTLADIDRSQVLYETTFTTRDTRWYNTTTPADSTNTGTTTIIGAPIAAGAFYTNGDNGVSTKGWLLKIEAKDVGAADSTLVTRTFMTTTDLTTTDTLITAMGTFATGFEFTITNNAGALQITANANKQIRIHQDSDVGPLGLAAKLWTATPITRNNSYTGGSQLFDGRATYLTYLNTIGAPPTALIYTIGGSTPVTGAITGVSGLGVTIGTGTIDFKATDAGNPNLTYTWTFSDLPLTDPANNLTGATVSRTIATANSFYANLLVKNNNTGETATKKVWVVVTKAVPTSTATVGVITTNQTGTTIPLSGLPTHTRLYVTWGDLTEQSFMDSGAAYTSTHTYYTVGQKTVTVKVINGSILDSSLPITATVNAYVTSSAGSGGSILPVGSNPVAYNSTQPYAITPTSGPYGGYYLNTLVVNGTAVTPASPYNFTATADVTAPLNTIAVTFGPTIQATVTGSGTITPAGTTNVPSGQDVTYYITANAGSHIASVTIDGGAAGPAVSNYTFKNVTTPHTISATMATP